MSSPGGVEDGLLSSVAILEISENISCAGKKWFVWDVLFVCKGKVNVVFI